MDDRLAEIDALPADVRGELLALLEAGESPQAAFRPDLDARLSFATSAIVLTDRRILGLGHGSPGGSKGEPAWSAWRLSPDLSATTRDNAGVGTLDLTSPDGLLATWRYTIARAKGERARGAPPHAYRELFRAKLSAEFV